MKKNNNIYAISKQSVGEEVANSISHGIGAALSIAGLVLLLIFGSKYGNGWNIVSLSIYGTSLFILYIASTLYHSFTNKKVKKILRKIDHISIFVLIAGTYTPITLISLRGALGWAIFGILWGVALIGSLFKIFFTGSTRLRHKIISMILYLSMSLSIILVMKPALDLLPAGMMKWILIGGASYIFGLIFFALKMIPFHHFIWHLFVLGGSISHFFGMLFYMTSM